MKKPFLVALVLVCVLISFIWVGITIRSFRMENAELRASAAEMEQLREENSRLARLQADPAELQRLRNYQSELLRLRSEVTQLRQQLKDKQLLSTKSAGPATSLKEKAATPGDQPVSLVDTYVATTQAAVGPQQTLVTGGWMLPSGKRAVVLIQPRVWSGAANEPGQIMIQTQIAELPEGVLGQVGLDRLKSETKQSSSQAILTSEQTELLVNTLQQTAGVDLLAAPKITTLDGRQAQVKVSNEIKTAASGESYEIGPSIDIVPRISADGASIDLTVNAQLRFPTAAVAP